MFDAEDHRPYVALCRELRLAREFEKGDWLVTAGGSPQLWMAERSLPPYLPDRLFWLPRLDQLLSMLTAAGAVSIRLWREGEVYGVEVIVPGIGSPSETASSWEEGAALLWCAVTGRMVSG